ncbi:energy-coupled thiamine transporter ThiT [Oribacterium sp. WCC10]|uniref:energy-coupled thiamine transporter ThiT n=1 Tax=Oribacterium sp. WCC10 TaxID=1855343 RepID=UPI0008E09D63|nr:energy-coupled thiamine transporter ThiT [Oribacterium sp. WCC10]SFG21287.1 thiamine transporter [Oribacterium sp. WCC10]
MSKNVKTIVFCAACIALATITSMIKIFHFPTGGSITLCSSLFAILPGFFFGPVTGIITGVAYGLLQLIVDPYILTPVQAFIDYILAFGALGVSGFFSNKKNGLCYGYIAACILRWFFAFLSGVLFFGEYAWAGWNPVPYSAVYNLICIGSEAILTLVVLQVPAFINAFTTMKSSINTAH